LHAIVSGISGNIPEDAKLGYTIPSILAYTAPVHESYTNTEQLIGLPVVRVGAVYMVYSMLRYHFHHTVVCNDAYDMAKHF